MFLKQWWVLSYPREDLLLAMSKLDRYVVCGRVTRRPIFEFVSTRVRPNDALQVGPKQRDNNWRFLWTRPTYRYYQDDFFGGDDPSARRDRSPAPFFQQKPVTACNLRIF
jgi:hypothetical protein